jgi:DNA phosphorothioation-associated putative methyltransferase
MLSISPHKTAIRRFELSRPLKLALQDGLLRQDFSLFDYGCGLGDDLNILESMNFECSGWDPAHRQDSEKVAAEVVNLGYVINVIEKVQDRVSVLSEAFQLSSKVLVVSAMLDVKSNLATNFRMHGDGYVTSRGTFQKLYEQAELKDFIISTLNQEAFPAAPGIFYVFRDEALKEEFLQNKITKHIHFKRREPLTLIEKYASEKELLEKFLDRMCELGRIPTEEEFSLSTEIKSRIGSLKKAYSIVNSFFPDNLISDCQRRREEDLLVYLALINFRKIPALKNLSLSLKNDMKIFFGNYKDARERGKELLFQAGNPELIASACRKSKIGKLLPEDLYIHKEYVDHLSPILRVYVGCGNAFIGDIEEANIIKIHMNSGKISYLEYEDFDGNPHPRLLKTTTVMFKELRMKEIDFSERENPPILHRKETLVAEDYPHYEKFKKLTEDEEKAGLLDHASGIGFRLNWEKRLQEMGYTFSDHDLVPLK